MELDSVSQESSLLIQQLSGISAHSPSRVASTTYFSTLPRSRKLCEGRADHVLSFASGSHRFGTCLASAVTMIKMP